MPNNPEEYIYNKLGLNYFHVVLYYLAEDGVIVYEEVTDDTGKAEQIRQKLETFRAVTAYNTALFTTVNDELEIDSFENNEINGHEIVAHYGDLDDFETRFLDETTQQLEKKPRHGMAPTPKKTFQEAFDEIEELAFVRDSSKPIMEQEWVNNSNSVYALLQELQANYAPEEKGQ